MKAEYLNRLGVCLEDHLSRDEINNAILYYDELIIEAVEAGKTEEEVLRGLGSVEDVAAKIKAEAYYNRAEKKGKMSGYLKAIIAVLGVLAVPMVIPVVAVIFSLLVALFAIVIAIFATALSIGIAAIVTLGIGFVSLFSGQIALGLSMIAAGMILSGITIFAVLLAIKITQGLKFICSKIFRAIFRKLNKKGGASYE